MSLDVTTVASHPTLSNGLSPWADEGDGSDSVVSHAKLGTTDEEAIAP